jgi:hypothetical protein
MQKKAAILASIACLTAEVLPHKEHTGFSSMIGVVGLVASPTAGVISLSIMFDVDKSQLALTRLSICFPMYGTRVTFL